SGGMRKRAGLARALALDPELLFLDEPTAGLDPIGAANFDHLLRELRAFDEDFIRELALLKLDMVDIDRRAAARMPSELSGGMVKRVGLARALALEPELLFLDEPTAGLDPDRSESFVSLIASLRDRLELTVVMVTHDLDTLHAICDRVAVLLDKRIVAGTMAELLVYDHPWVREYFHGPRGRAAGLR
ncbi:MAG TPA: ATP-binding cassette domain-containing protein, partial [Vineibacter sp.]|nr:ATP-binding cassette domain-containing protein [Vineibacter sp.]